MNGTVAHVLDSRRRAIERGDWNLVREFDNYLTRLGIPIPDGPADAAKHAAVPAELEQAVVPVKRGPGRPRKHPLPTKE